MDYIKITTGLFVILNPFVLIPVFLSLAGQIERLLGHNGLKVLGRIMGIILLAVSVDFLIFGIRQAFDLTS
ncbi:MAG: hypothetical protein JW984_12235 [Deltaproteobacteria bacterium]|uniref:UPF0056 membrane protein n=1 Tax=Candidatus Zymogenus saltonus TaxID=2844893 RepID=A0A9D8KHP3_9DELT|nr:hypothetical protein [Candidatus Zymogenus saltonus]